MDFVEYLHILIFLKKLIKVLRKSIFCVKIYNEK